MECVKKYTVDHYSFYYKRADDLIENNKDIDSWVRNLNDKNILIWLNVLKRVNDNDEIYFQELAIFLTILIRLFALELDVEDNFILKNSELIKLVKRFDYVIKREYGYRKKFIQNNDKPYTLLKDTKEG